MTKALLLIVVVIVIIEDNQLGVSLLFRDCNCYINRKGDIHKLDWQTFKKGSKANGTRWKENERGERVDVSLLGRKTTR